MNMLPDWKKFCGRLNFPTGYKNSFQYGKDLCQPRFFWEMTNRNLKLCNQPVIAQTDVVYLNFNFEIILFVGSDNPLKLLFADLTTWVCIPASAAAT